MDRVFSTRLDEAVLNEMERITRQLRITKKQFLEDAIRSHARQVTAEGGPDIWAETSGAWKRKESPAATIRRVRRKVKAGFERHHRRT